MLTYESKAGIKPALLFLLLWYNIYRNIFSDIIIYRKEKGSFSLSHSTWNFCLKIMKKFILIFFAIILIAVLVLFGVYKFREKKSIETGDIQIKDKVEQEAYEEISENAYYGEINYRNFYIIFKPTSYEGDIGSEYECTIIEDYGNERYGGDSFYDVSIDKAGNVIFNYTSGENEFFMEGTYDNALTINGVTMKKIDVSEVKPAAYGYGEFPDATVDEHNQ